MLRGADGCLYDSKAIVGAAYGVQHPDQGPLTAGNFSGGEATVERKLLDLGFDVVRVGDAWARDEVELAVEDYFAMLTLESARTPFNKAERNRELRSRLRNRSKGSIELKHQNISAVLDDLNLPYVEGYKPLSNVQELLREVVQATVVARHADIERILDAFDHVPLPSTPMYAAALVDPPKVEAAPIRSNVRLPRRCDYAARDEYNRALGNAGEIWSVGYEQFRLSNAGLHHLAGRVDWVSHRLGDGLGYDIQSFELESEPRFIEVKTTCGPGTTQFMVTRNELEFSREAGDAFCIYRLFDFGRSPRMFILRGELDRHASLTPTSFRARLK
jgi:hypothetical protein